MSEVILSSPSLSVLGGPASINVQLESGSPGKRGSSIFFSNGDPAIPGNLDELPQLFDLAINVSPSDPEYRYLYQYQNFDGTFTWQKMISLSPGIASFSIASTFDSQGNATVSIPITDIAGSYSPGLFSLEDFVIIASVVRDTQPVAASISTPSLATDENDIQSISFTVSAAGIDIANLTSPVSPLTGTHTVMCSISIGQRVDTSLPA